MQNESDEVQLILHIGSPKTGTTNIQSACVKNHDILLEQGVLYPETGRKNVAHHRLAWSVSPHGPKIEPEPLYNQLRIEIEKSAANRVLIDSEVFFLDVDIELLARLLKGFLVKVVVYLRPQDEWYYGMYLQYIKEDRYRINAGPFEAEEMEVIRRHLNYSHLLNKWSDVFGKENVIARPYQKSTIGNDVLTDYFSLLDINKTDQWVAPVDPGQRNISLPEKLVELVRLSNVIHIDSASRNRWLYVMQRITEKFSLSQKVTVSRRKSIKEIYELGNLYRSSNEYLSLYSATSSGKDIPFFQDIPSSSYAPSDVDDKSFNNMDLVKIAAEHWVMVAEECNHYLNIKLALNNNIPPKQEVSGVEVFVVDDGDELATARTIVSLRHLASVEGDDVMVMSRGRQPMLLGLPNLNVVEHSQLEETLALLSAGDGPIVLVRSGVLVMRACADFVDAAKDVLAENRVCRFDDFSGKAAMLVVPKRRLLGIVCNSILSGECASSFFEYFYEILSLNDCHNYRTSGAFAASLLVAEIDCRPTESVLGEFICRETERFLGK